MDNLTSPYDQQIQEAEARFREAQQQLHELRLKKAQHLCPFKIGDILIDKRGWKAKVSFIRDKDWEPGYEMSGTRIKKDGNEGQTITLYEWDEWKLATG